MKKTHIHLLSFLMLSLAVKAQFLDANFVFDTIKTDSNIIIKNSVVRIEYKHRTYILLLDFLQPLQSNEKENYFNTGLNITSLDSIFHIQIMDFYPLSIPCLEIGLLKKMISFTYNTFGEFEFSKKKLPDKCFCFQDLEQLEIITGSTLPTVNIKKYLTYNQDKCKEISLYGERIIFGDDILALITENQKNIEVISLSADITKIPDNIYNLKELTTLNILTDKELELNSGLMQVEKLTMLSISIDFTKIKNWEIITKLFDIEYLALNDISKKKNKIKIPETLKNLIKLKHLVVKTNKKIILPSNFGEKMDSLEFISIPFDCTDTILLLHLNKKESLESIEIPIIVDEKKIYTIAEFLKNKNNVTLYAKKNKKIILGSENLQNIKLLFYSPRSMSIYRNKKLKL